jgi:hypothetical protein
VNELNETYQDELAHYGIAGMKWGIRRYQNPDGTLTEAGKKRYGTVENLEAGRTKRQADKYEAAKKSAIASGSAKEISKYASDMSNAEMNDALNRVRNKQALDALVISEGQTKLDNVIKTAGNVASAATNVTKAYNAGAKIVNTFTGKNLPIVGINEAEYKLAKSFAEDKRQAQVDNQLQSHDLAYIKKHADQFTADEIQDAIKRDKALQGVDNRLGGNKGNDSSSSGDQGSKGKKGSNNDSSSGKKSEPPQYSEPSQEVKPKTVSEPPKYSEPSRTTQPKTTSEPPKYSTPSTPNPRDNSIKVSSLTKPEYTIPSNMRESSEVVNRLADDVVTRGKSRFNRYWGIS